MAKDKRVSGGPNNHIGEKGPMTGGCLRTNFTKERKDKFCEALAGPARGQREAAARMIGLYYCCA